jgi:hypothetical protein
VDGGDVASIRQRCLANVRAVVECGQHMGSQHHWSPFFMSRAPADHAPGRASCTGHDQVSLSVCTERVACVVCVRVGGLVRACVCV